MFFFNRNELEIIAQNFSGQFENSEPFQHVVIDDFLPLKVANKIAAEFSEADKTNWRLAGPGDSKHSGDPEVEKISLSDEQGFPDGVRQLMHSMQSGIFIRFIEKLTGFSHLNADPHNFGCGLHSTGNGGRLMLHVDASRHPNKDFQQLINVIYYCTPDWHEEYGGHLELWDKEAKKCVKKVAPIFNRAVIFYTGRYSYHGHPEPISCPKTMRRNSMALYFYTTKKEQSNIGHSNYVEWKAVTKHDKRSLYHYSKNIIRKILPRRTINWLATVFRSIKRWVQTRLGE